jgi:hypothetical protein
MGTRLHLIDLAHALINEIPQVNIREHSLLALFEEIDYALCSFNDLGTY